MGLDGVELVLATEDEFQIAISDEEACKCETTDMLTNLVYSKLRKSAEEVCPSMHGFYVARKAMMEYFSLPREKIRLEAMLDDLITRKNRSVIWKSFLKALSDGQTMYAPLIRPRWLKASIYVVSIAAFLLAYIETQSASLSIILSFVVGFVFHTATSFLSVEFPKNFQSVRDLTRVVATLDSNVWNRDDVYLRVKQLIVEQLVVKESDVKPNSHFIRDLGMD